MYTQLQICNRALRLIRQTPINSLEEHSKEAEECNFLYLIVKNEVLEEYPWKAARKSTVLDNSCAAPLEKSNYSYKFILPLDCIKVMMVNSATDFSCDGMYLYANTAALKLCYIAAISEEQLTLRLVKIIALKLALELAKSLLGCSELMAALEEELERELKKAKQQDSIDYTLGKGSIGANYKASWLNSR